MGTWFEKKKKAGIFSFLQSTRVENGKKHRQNSHPILYFPTSERCERMSERTSEWPSTYVSILVCSRPQCSGSPGVIFPDVFFIGAASWHSSLGANDAPHGFTSVRWAGRPALSAGNERWGMRRESRELRGLRGDKWYGRHERWGLRDEKWEMKDKRWWFIVSLVKVKEVWQMH